MGAARASLVRMAHAFRLLAVLGIATSLAACAPPAEERSAGNGTAPASRDGSAGPVETERTPAEVVETLGARLDMVSILAPPDAVARAMRDSWGALVDPSLLERWIANPAGSPGAATSSPRPDRIEVQGTEMLGEDRAMVRGTLVESTSTGDTARRPVRVELARRDGRWLVTSFTGEDPPAAGEDDARGAVRVVEELYAAVDAGDLRRAWDLWGPGGAPGLTFDRFAAGYASTASVEVETGPPSRVEGAAGSRYVEVPVTVSARQDDGSLRRFEGTYTVRRSVVDGAAPSQQRWHLYRADLRAAGEP